MDRHRLFQDKLNEEIEYADRHDQPVVLVMVDADNFKSYNDTLGHPAGDALLIEIAALLKDKVRAADIVCRYGGDEFALLLKNTRKEDAARMCERIREALAAGGPVESLQRKRDELSVKPVNLPMLCSQRDPKKFTSRTQLNAFFELASYARTSRVSYRYRGGKISLELKEPLCHSHFPPAKALCPASLPPLASAEPRPRQPKPRLALTIRRRNVFSPARAALSLWTWDASAGPTQR